MFHIQGTCRILTDASMSESSCSDLHEAAESACFSHEDNGESANFEHSEVS